MINDATTRTLTRIGTSPGQELHDPTHCNIRLLVAAAICVLTLPASTTAQVTVDQRQSILKEAQNVLTVKSLTFSKPDANNNFTQTITIQNVGFATLPTSAGYDIEVTLVPNDKSCGQGSSGWHPLIAAPLASGEITTATRSFQAGNSDIKKAKCAGKWRMVLTKPDGQKITLPSIANP